MICNLTADNGKDILTLSPAELIFIESSDNYCTVYFFRDEKLQQRMLRGSLSRMESQLTVGEIMRCHRSYIVNLKQVESVSGNAQGYKLRVRRLAEPIAVGRTYSDAVLARLMNR